MMKSAGFSGVLYGAVTITPAIFASYTRVVKLQALTLMLETGLSVARIGVLVGVSSADLMLLYSGQSLVPPIGGCDDDFEPSIDDAADQFLSHLIESSSGSVTAHIAQLAASLEFPASTMRRAIFLLESNGFVRKARKPLRGKPTTWQITPVGQESYRQHQANETSKIELAGRVVSLWADGFAKQEIASRLSISPRHVSDVLEKSKGVHS